MFYLLRYGVVANLPLSHRAGNRIKQDYLVVLLFTKSIQPLHVACHLRHRTSSAWDCALLLYIIQTKLVHVLVYCADRYLVLRFRSACPLVSIEWFPSRTLIECINVSVLIEWTIDNDDSTGVHCIHSVLTNQVCSITRSTCSTPGRSCNSQTYWISSERHRCVSK